MTQHFQIVDVAKAPSSALKAFGDDGKVTWRVTPFGKDPIKSFAVAADAVFVCTGPQGGSGPVTIARLDRQTGAEQARTDVPFTISPAPQNVTYLPNTNQIALHGFMHLHLLDGATLTLNWGGMPAVRTTTRKRFGLFATDIIEMTSAPERGAPWQGIDQDAKTPVFDTPEGEICAIAAPTPQFTTMRATFAPMLGLFHITQGKTDPTFQVLSRDTAESRWTNVMAPSPDGRYLLKPTREDASPEIMRHDNSGIFWKQQATFGLFDTATHDIARTLPILSMVQRRPATSTAPPQGPPLIQTIVWEPDSSAFWIIAHKAYRRIALDGARSPVIYAAHTLSDLDRALVDQRGADPVLSKGEIMQKNAPFSPTLKSLSVRADHTVLVGYDIITIPHKIRDSSAAFVVLEDDALNRTVIKATP